jgi:hypothetical protein
VFVIWRKHRLVAGQHRVKLAEQVVEEIEIPARAGVIVEGIRARREEEPIRAVALGAKYTRSQRYGKT